MKVQDTESRQTEIYFESKSRWFQLTLYLGALCSNLIFGFSISPIAKELAIIYDVNDRYISTLIISFTLFSALMIIPGNIMSEKYGIASNIKLGCLLTFIGAILALFVNFSFWFLYAGQVISLIGFPFRLISASKFAANWFFPKNRVMIMVIIALTFNACSGLSIRIPLLIFNDYRVEDDQTLNHQEGRDMMFELVLFLGVVVSLLTVPTLFLFKSKPQHPPSYSASDACVRENYSKAARMLIRNKDFLLLALSFSLLLGPVLLLTVQMEYVVKPFGFTLVEISNLVGVGVVAGLAGDILVGSISKSLKKYKIVFTYCNFITTFFYAFLIVTLWLKQKVLFYISYFLVCLSSSVMAITFEFSCELSFPVSETSTIAFLGLAGNGFNFIQAIPETLILNLDSEVASTITLILMFGINLSGNFTNRFIKEKLKRTHEDDIHDSHQSLIASDSEQE